MMRNFLDIKVLGAIFLLSILKILHFLILLTQKHLHNWRLYYVSISGRHKRDISWAARGVHRWLRTWIEETTWHMWVHKWTVKWRYMWSFYFVDCIHNMSSRSSCQETLCSKKQWMKQEEEESAQRCQDIEDSHMGETSGSDDSGGEKKTRSGATALVSHITHKKSGFKDIWPDS